MNYNKDMKKDAVSIALNFLKFRARSVFEIERRLKKDKFSDTEIHQTIEVLKRNKLLDDFEFAKMYVRDRNLFKPSGASLLKMELRQLGLRQEVIEDVLKDQNEEKLAHEAIESKSKYRTADFEKQAQFLSRRGFKPSTIYKVLKNNQFS